MSPDPPSFAALLQRFDPEPDQPPEIIRVSFAAALARGDDPLKVLSYLAGIGISVRCIDDLLLINDDQTEDELHAFRVTEGVAVSIASDGTWLLFEP